MDSLVYEDELWHVTDCCTYGATVNALTPCWPISHTAPVLGDTPDSGIGCHVDICYQHWLFWHKLDANHKVSNSCRSLQNIFAPIVCQRNQWLNTHEQLLTWVTYENVLLLECIISDCFCWHFCININI